ncbi:MAG TPA: geranylgeranyl reductase family protein [Anaerolineales bacterium]
MSIYDTIVVGGGPGGGAAAYFLGEAGKRVLVLEKETLPRYKACGGGLSLNLLKQFPFSFEPVIESHVQSISYALGKQEVTFPLPERSMAMVMRDQFDAHLLAHTQAEVRQGTAVRKVIEVGDRVVVETRAGETFEGRTLVAADGANSVVAHSLGLRRGKTLVAAIEAEVPVPDPVMRQFVDAPMFIFGEARLGYLWIFPKAAHLSVGIAALHPKPGELQVTLERVMARYGISLEGVPLRGHPIPIFIRREPITTARSLLVGDAAGLVDPFSGEGIRFAIKSGRLAAEAILSGQVKRYPNNVFREIGLNHFFAYGLAQIFYRHPRACFALGVRNPFATQAFVELLGDKVRYPEVIVRLFGSLPIFFAAEGVAALAGLLPGSERANRSRRPKSQSEVK